MRLSKEQCLARAEVYETLWNHLCTTDWTDDDTEKEQGVKVAVEMYEQALVWQERANKRK